MMRAALILSTVGVLAGCAATPTTYNKPGIAQEQFQRDMWECQQIVNQSYQQPNQSSGAGGAFGYMIGRSVSEKGRHRDCMYGRGYQIQQ
jgi:hypothetical protein